jgi:hypothetical protein
MQLLTSIIAKPGFGKTTLATLVIDRLKSNSTSFSGYHSQQLAFYFFDKQNGNSNQSYDAYRALLSQLIHLRRHDEKVIDIAAVARPDHDTGQSFASDNEVYNILHLLLLHIGSCFIVLDGIDECANREDLFKGLSRISSDHEHCRMILLGRPNVRLPPNFSNRCEFLALGISKNMEDLTKYIEPQVHDLIDSGDLILPELVSLEKVTEMIVSKANGMFLWVTLFMEYLRLPSLTISGRWKDIEDPSRCEGLYNLYEDIFAALRKDYPSSTQVKLRRALQWVCGTFRPLQIKELQVAIEIEPNVVLGPLDVIPNFAQALGPMSGALLEVTREETVRLIHITLYEYLVSKAPKLPASRDSFGSSVSFTPQALHHYISMACLSYLKNTVPVGPYGRLFPLGRQLPLNDYHLMEYSTKFWISHFFSMSIGMKSASETEQYSSSCQSAGESWVDFISDRIKFTSWIESFWHLGLHQQLQQLLGRFLGPVHPHNSEVSLTKAISLLRLLWEEQMYLLSSWRKVLEKNPEEV